MQRREVLPDVGVSVELFRRADADRTWLGDLLARAPSRLLYVGHATAADGDVGHADRAALHLADERPLTASDLMSLKLPCPHASPCWPVHPAATTDSTRRPDSWRR